MQPCVPVRQPYSYSVPIPSQIVTVRRSEYIHKHILSYRGLRKNPPRTVYILHAYLRGLKKRAAAGYEMYMLVLVAPPNEIPQQESSQWDRRLLTSQAFWLRGEGLKGLSSQIRMAQMTRCDIAQLLQPDRLLLPGSRISGQSQHNFTAKKIRFMYSQKRKMRGLSPNFHIHVPVSDLYIPAINPPIFLQYINKSF